MSIEMTDKKARKEAKRAAKLAKLAAETEAEPESSPKDKSQKDKKGKAKDQALLPGAIAAEADEKMDVDPSAGTVSAAVGLDEVAQAKAEKKRLKAERKARKAEKRAKREREADGADETPAGVEEATKASARLSKTDGEGESARPKKKKRSTVDTPTPAETVISTPVPDLDIDRSSKKAVKADGAKDVGSSSKPTSSSPRPLSAEDKNYLSDNAITLLPPLYPPSLSIPSLPIHSALLAHLSKFDRPTPIQACTWAPLLDGRDVVGIAETGSGKTLAFGIPALHRLSTGAGSSSASSSQAQANGKAKLKGKGASKGKIGVLVLAPTRELAQQSHETFLDAGKKLGISSTCIFGGVGKEGQYKDLRDPKVRVVVGTPGRTLDLADAGDLDLSNISYLVLDEADRMLDQGFENDIRRIIAHCPGNEARQTVMFSATWPESVRRLASTFLRDPIRVTVGSDELSANKRIEQVVEVLDDVRQKDSRMLHHLKSHLAAHPSSAAAPTRILVFALYKKEAQRLEYTIRRSGYSIAGLHGDLSQDARFKALDKFKKGEVKVLVATDVAARGLDIPDVGLVLNVTFPLTTEDFVHRCGRTGRAGKTGKAVTLFTGEGHERALAGELMRVLRDAGAKVPKEMDRFPTTIKKKEHGSYGAFFKDISDAPAPTKIVFD